MTNVDEPDGERRTPGVRCRLFGHNWGGMIRLSPGAAESSFAHSCRWCPAEQDVEQLSSADTRQTLLQDVLTPAEWSVDPKHAAIAVFLMGLGVVLTAFDSAAAYLAWGLAAVTWILIDRNND